MKIVIISNTEDEALILQKVISSSFGSEQIQHLGRIEDSLHLDRVDLPSTDIIIVDSDAVHDADVRAISAIAHGDTPHPPSFIYLASSTSHEELLRLIRGGVSDVLHRPIQPAEIRDAIDRIRSKRLHIGRTSKCKVLSFVSGKGGAGATFLATNLGYLLATEANKKVLYIDLHMQGGDASFYLTNTVATTTLADIVKSSELDSMMISAATIPIESNYSLLPSPDSPEKAAGLTAANIDNLISVAMQDYDFIIVDLPHILDALTIKALDRSDLIFVVTQPIMTYLRAVAHMLHLFTRLEYDPSKVRMVLNRMDKVGMLSVARVEDSIQKNISLTVPNDFMNAVEAVNIGVSIIKNSPKSPISTALRGILSELLGETVEEPEQKSFFQKMLGK